MGVVSPELSLDLKPSFVPQTIQAFLRDVSFIGDAPEKLDKIDGFLTRLDEEMKKIEVFKRELPLCMLLLKDAILVLRQESSLHRTINAHQPVLEEFIPLKKDSDDVNTQINPNDKNNNKTDEADSAREKKDWMSSVQLWNSDHSPASTPQNCDQNQTLDSENQKEYDKQSKLVVIDDMYDPCKSMSGSKGFMPAIHTYPNYPEIKRKVEKDEVGVPGLSLLIPGIKQQNVDSLSNGLSSKLGGGGLCYSSSIASNGHSNLQASHQQSTIRKQRRCWSPELHRRFVDSLTQLGGPQVATPKQIRDLMQVDGLTNDEVKSHLQKYRLHARRIPNRSATSTNVNGNAMASSWETRDQCSDSSKPSNSQSGSPQGPLQFTGITGMEEDEDDEKSESYSWKGHVHTTGNDDV